MDADEGGDLACLVQHEHIGAAHDDETSPDPGNRGAGRPIQIPSPALAPPLFRVGLAFMKETDAVVQPEKALARSVPSRAFSDGIFRIDHQFRFHPIDHWFSPGSRAPSGCAVSL